MYIKIITKTYSVVNKVKYSTAKASSDDEWWMKHSFAFNCECFQYRLFRAGELLQWLEYYHIYICFISVVIYMNTKCVWIFDKLGEYSIPIRSWTRTTCGNNGFSPPCATFRFAFLGKRFVWEKLFINLYFIELLIYPIELLLTSLSSYSLHWALTYPIELSLTSAVQIVSSQYVPSLSPVCIISSLFYSAGVKCKALTNWHPGCLSLGYSSIEAHPGSRRLAQVVRGPRRW